MNPTGALFHLVFAGSSVAWAGDNAVRFPSSAAIIEKGTGGDSCGELLMNADGSYESAYAWAYGGIAPPAFGSFAECYQGEAAICAIVIDATAGLFQSGNTSSLLVWDDAGGEPGNVLVNIVKLLPVGAYWPSVERFRVELPEPCCVSDRWWVGQRGDWPEQAAEYFIGADIDGPGGCPRTNIAPGLGFPTGWQNVSVVFGETAAMGLGAEIVPCAPVAARTRTWGAIKELYR